MSAEHDRDKAMDEMLRRTLHARPAAEASAACLDAETIAAWMDGGLDGRALSQAEAHVAGCTRCQAVVGVMVRVPALAPAGWWRRRWEVRWLVPIAAGAAAVAVWMIVPEQRPPAAPSIQKAPVEARADAPAPNRIEATAPAAAPARSGGVTPAAPATPPAAPSSALSETTAVARSDAETASKAEAQSAPAPAGRRAEDRATGEPAAAAAPKAGTVMALGRVRQQQAKDGSPTLEIVSPDPAIRWRAGANGAVEYSTSGGSTWQSLSTGTTAELTTGSSPSPAVCWLAGRGGIILLTTDGRRWRRVPFPESADLSSIEATDARAAVAKTADGRTFRTSDAGQTWQR